MLRDNAQITDFIECEIGTVTRAGISAHAFLLTLHVTRAPAPTGTVVAIKCRRPGLSKILADYREHQHRAEIDETQLRVVKKAAVVISIFKNSGDKNE